MSCYVDGANQHFYWSEEAQSWMPFEASEAKYDEEKDERGADDEGKRSEGEEEEEKEKDEQKEPQTWAEVRPNEHLYKQKLKVSTTRRKPPPKSRPRPPAKGRDPPPRRRPPPTAPHPSTLKGARVEPDLSEAERKRQNCARDLSDEKQSSSDEEVDGALNATTSKDPQMLLMEAVAGQNLKLIKLVLQNPLLSSRDIHAALMNATAKGGYEIARALVGKASEKCLSGCLLIACKLANIDLIKMLIPLVKQAGLSHAIIAGERVQGGAS